VTDTDTGTTEPERELRRVNYAAELYQCGKGLL
jgi:hypothetical protein